MTHPSDTAPLAVELLIDPASAQHSRAARWLAIVEQRRPIRLTLTMAPTEAGRPVARVALAASDLMGPDGAPMLYEAYARHHHVLGEDEGVALDAALAELRLPGFLGFATGDAKWDAGLAPASDKPLLIDGRPHAVPELAEVPVGADATELFDALASS